MARKNTILRTSNYELQCDAWANKICTLDPARLCKTLPELQREGDHLLLWHFGRRIALDLRNGSLSCASDNKPLSLNLRFNVYTLLWYVKPNATQSGSWVSFADLKDASPYAPAFQKTVLKSLAATFAGREDALEVAVEALRGSRINANSYFLPAFACIPMRVQFWDGDEDFPAQANLLFDQNATDFIHVESIVTIASEALSQLATAANLPIISK